MTQPSPSPAPSADWLWITSSDALRELAQRFASAPWLAFDTESNSMYVYQEQVCLMQINLGGFLAIIDPLSLEPGREGLGPLADALENPDLPVYLHGGEYDCVCMQRDYGVTIRSVFDTQQAASLLGWDKTGYGAVVERVCGVVLPKAHSDYNWGQRPIASDALTYAIDDVRYLPEAVAALRTAISEADIDEECTIANQAVESVQARPPGFDPSALWRLKGISEVPNRRLPVAVALHQWRDDTARSLNRPPGRVLANDLIVALARKAPTNIGGLRSLRLRSSLLRDHADDLLRVISSALQQPPEIPPAPHRAAPDPSLRDRENALKAWRREEAERRAVTTQVVLPARALDYLKRNGASDLNAVPQLGAKRIALYGEALTRLAPPPPDHEDNRPS